LKKTLKNLTNKGNKGNLADGNQRRRCSA